MQTYIQKIQNKEVPLTEESLDDFIDYWHTSDVSRNISLHSAIGVSWEEYSKHINHNFLDFLKTKI